TAARLGAGRRWGRCGPSRRSEMTDALHARVLAALRGVAHPAKGDVLTAGLVRNLGVSDAGEVAFTFLLGRHDPATLVRQVRKAVEGVPGVEPPARIQVTDPSGP